MREIKRLYLGQDFFKKLFIFILYLKKMLVLPTTIFIVYYMY